MASRKGVRADLLAADRDTFGAMTWLSWSLLSAFFAAATAILAKLGIKGVDANVATAVRLPLSWCSLGC